MSKMAGHPDACPAAGPPLHHRGGWCKSISVTDESCNGDGRSFPARWLEATDTKLEGEEPITREKSEKERKNRDKPVELQTEASSR